LDEDVRFTTWSASLPPWGTLLDCGAIPDDRMGQEYNERTAIQLFRYYEKLLRSGFREIKMASTLLFEGFEGYEITDLGREASPDSVEDWTELSRISNENIEREEIIRKELKNLFRFRTTKDPDRVRKASKGIIAAAKIRATPEK
jgi:hypothetical protein